MADQIPIKTRPLPKTDLKEMLWALLRDRITEDARKVLNRPRSYVEANRVPGAGE